MGAPALDAKARRLLAERSSFAAGNASAKFFGSWWWTDGAVMVRVAGWAPGAAHFLPSKALGYAHTASPVKPTRRQNGDIDLGGRAFESARFLAIEEAFGPGCAWKLSAEYLDITNRVGRIAFAYVGAHVVAALAPIAEEAPRRTQEAA